MSGAIEDVEKKIGAYSWKTFTQENVSIRIMDIF